MNLSADEIRTLLSFMILVPLCILCFIIIAGAIRFGHWTIENPPCIALPAVVVGVIGGFASLLTIGAHIFADWGILSIIARLLDTWI